MARKSQKSKPAIVPAKVGRPTSYQSAYCEMAYKLCLLGSTDLELADFFDVAESTIYLWKNEHPAFSEALKAGKQVADSQVADRLYQRATGYSHDAVKIFADPKSGNEKIVSYTEHYPPDTTAAIFWLKNRQAAKWREKQEVEHSGTVTLESLVGASMTASTKE